MNKLFSIFLLCSSLVSASQSFLSWKSKDRYFSLSMGVGTSTYLGELNSKNSINGNLSLVTGGIEVRLLNRIATRVDISYISLKGSDANAGDSTFQRQRNLSFSSRNFHTQLHIIFYLKSYQGDYYKRWRFDPFLFSGIGYMNFNPTATLGKGTYDLRKARTEGIYYKKWITTIPVGIGGKFRINEFLNINFEVSYHFTFTDYLDDVSDTYAINSENVTAKLLSDRKDEIGVIHSEFYDQIQPGAKRGNPNDNDRFFQISLRIEIFLPPNLFSKQK